MKKKVLLVATVQSHIAQFHKPLIDMLHEMGYEVHIAAKNNLLQKNGLKIENADKIFDISFERQPFKIKNIKAYFELKNIIKENDYNILHCNTPMGGVIARMIGKKYRKKGLKIIYTAHGFHFFEGAPKINWMLYYPIEKYLSKFTDCLITMNKEDYDIAKNKFYAKKVVYTHGIGLNTKKFNIEMSPEEKEKLRKKLGISQKDFIIIYVAELINRKNHYMILNTMKKFNNKQNIKVLLVGNGNLEEEYKKYLKENHLEENIKMLGYRIDVPQLMKISDIAISTSKQEGLPVNVMEAMISGLPDIVTNCRGNRDLIENEKNGYVIDINNESDLYEKIIKLYNDPELRKKMGQKGKELIAPFELKNVIVELKNIYMEVENMR